MGLHHHSIGSASIENPVEALPPGVGLALTLDMEARDGVTGVVLLLVSEWKYCTIFEFVLLIVSICCC